MKTTLAPDERQHIARMIRGERAFLKNTLTVDILTALRTGRVPYPVRVTRESVYRSLENLALENRHKWRDSVAISGWYNKVYNYTQEKLK